jgi:large subunit ribosomal protein L21
VVVFVREIPAMYAVIRSGGKQHRVQPGGKIRVEKIDGDVGSKVELKEVLMIEKDGEITVGDPLIAKAKVSAEILAQDRATKIIVFKMKRKKQYRRKRGHRQAFTELLVDKIKA